VPAATARCHAPNESGHYKPSGVDAREAVIIAFQRIGFDVADVYQELEFGP